MVSQDRWSFMTSMFDVQDLLKDQEFNDTYSINET